MKTPEQIAAARTRLRERLLTPGLTDVQKSLLMGMLNAIVWVADGENCDTFRRMLSDEPMHAGKDHTKPMQRLDEKLGNLRQGKHPNA